MKKVFGVFLSFIGAVWGSSDKSYDIPWLKGQDIPAVQGSLMTLRHVGHKTYQIIVICGTKGAGKTSTMAKLEANLKAAGLYVQVFAPFQDMNTLYKNDQGGYGKLIRSLADARGVMAKHEQFVDQDIAQFEKNLLSSLASKGVLLFDRGWLTILTSLIVAKDMSTSEQRRIWRHYWMNHVYPTAFLEANPMRTFERRHGQLDVKSGLPSDELVWSDYFRRKLMAGRFKNWVFAHYNTSDVINDMKVDEMASGIATKIIDAFTIPKRDQELGS